MRNFFIYGAGGNGREAMSIFKQFLHKENEKSQFELYFVETNPTSSFVGDVELISEADMNKFPSSKSFFNVSISNTTQRSEIVKRVSKLGFNPFSIISPSSYVASDIVRSIGLILSPFSLISCDTQIGEFVHINYFVSISHDVIIGNFVSIGPGARINGNVIIKDHAKIGSQATIRQGSKLNPRVIGEGAVIAMGAVVLDNVDPYTMVAGNPAKVKKRLR